MRPIESYIMYLGMYTAFYGWVPLSGFATVALAVCLLAHVLIERPRLQFIIGYILACQTVFAVYTEKENSLLWALVAEVLYTMTAAAACLMPVARFPEPTGPHKKIGMTVLHLPGGPTSHGIVLRCFYPANPEKPGQRVRYISKAVMRAIAGYMKIKPAFVFDHVRLAYHVAGLNAEVLGTKEGRKFPVVLFSHGLGGTNDVYSTIAGDLASYGYIVVIPTHNDESAAVSILPNGGVVRFRPLTSEESSDIKKEKELRGKQLTIRVHEVRCIMDEICKNGDDPRLFGCLAGRMDKDRMGSAGHSFGAATAAAVATEDERIKAVAAHDLWLVPFTESFLSSGLPSRLPVLHTMSEAWLVWKPYIDDMKAFWKRCKNDNNRFVCIKGSKHLNYADLVLFCSIFARKIGAAGPIDLRRFFHIVGRLQGVFFMRNLESGLTAAEKPSESELASVYAQLLPRPEGAQAPKEYPELLYIQ